MRIGPLWVGLGCLLGLCATLANARQPVSAVEIGLEKRVNPLEAAWEAIANTARARFREVAGYDVPPTTLAIPASDDLETRLEPIEFWRAFDEAFVAIRDGVLNLALNGPTGDTLRLPDAFLDYFGIAARAYHRLDQVYETRRDPRPMLIRADALAGKEFWDRADEAWNEYLTQNRELGQEHYYPPFEKTEQLVHDMNAVLDRHSRVYQRLKDVAEAYQDRNPQDNIVNGLESLLRDLYAIREDLNERARMFKLGLDNHERAIWKLLGKSRQAATRP